MPTPESPLRSRPFHWDYVIDLTDLDYMNIVGNAAWLLILQKARGDLLRQLGYPIERLFEDGIGGVVQEARVLYLRSGRFMDPIRVETVATDPTNTGLILRHRVTHSATGKLLIKGELSMVFVDNGNGYKGMAMPEEIRRGLFG